MNLITAPVSHIQNFGSGFLDFISNANVLQFATALIMSNSLIELTNNFLDSIINPIINKLLKSDQEDLADYKVQIYGIEIKLGKLIISVFRFISIAFILYLIIRFSKLLKSTNETKSN